MIRSSGHKFDLPERDQPKDHGNVFKGGSHRQFVGGKWDEIGKLQFRFLIEQGLETDHVVLDVACGALRAGVHLIPYLRPGNYLGIEAEKALLRMGIDQELGQKLLQEKRPELLASRLFDFDSFSKRPNFAIAQSLFTHLNTHDIDRCMRQMRKCCTPETSFFVSFFEVAEARDNPELSHAQGYFAYTKEEMMEFGERSGFHGFYIGDWGHPREQKMFLYLPNPEFTSAID